MLAYRTVKQIRKETGQKIPPMGTVPRSVAEHWPDMTPENKRWWLEQYPLVAKAAEEELGRRSTR